MLSRYKRNIYGELCCRVNFKFYKFQKASGTMAGSLFVAIREPGVLQIEDKRGFNATWTYPLQ